MYEKDDVLRAHLKPIDQVPIHHNPIPLSPTETSSPSISPGNIKSPSSQPSASNQSPSFTSFVYQVFLAYMVTYLVHRISAE